MGMESGYRWYSVEEGGQPRNGFFVDREGHIFFWPSKKPPGYAVDAETAAKLKSLRIAGGSKQQRTAIAGFAVLLVFWLKYVYRDSYQHEKFAFITHTVSLPSALFCGLVLILGCLSIYAALVRRTRAPAITALLQACPRVNVPRPPLQYLKPSYKGRYAAYANSKIRVAFAWAIVGIMVVFGSILGLTSKLPGDPVVTVVAIPAIVWLWIRSRKIVRDGLSREQVGATAYLRSGAT